MDLLNLDDLQVVSRQVKLGGRTYPLREQSVGGMIQALRLTQAGKLTEKNAAAVFEQMLEVAGTLVPDAPKGVLSGMSFAQIKALLEFANASDKEVVESAEGDSKEAADNEGK